MPRVVGYGGQVDAPGAIIGIREWSIDYVAAALDSSGYDTGQDKAFIIGQKEFSGSFSGFKDGAPIPLGTAILFDLHEDSAVGTQRWEGNGYITNIRAASSVDGIVTYAYDFQGTGTIVTIPTT